jgi:DNA-binding GntR family transcriptional regulator
MGMVLVDRSHDDPGALIPVHRKMYQLLAAGKLKECAAVLMQHLDDSESRLSRVMNGEMPKKKRNTQAEKARVSRGVQTGSRRRV